MADTEIIEETSEETSEETTSAVVTADDVKNYLGIDYSDTMTTANIERAIQTADYYLRGSIGDNYPTTDPRAKELALIIVADLFDNRSLQAQGGGTVSSTTRKLVNDFSLQLRLELRRGSSG